MVDIRSQIWPGVTMLRSLAVPASNVPVGVPTEASLSTMVPAMPLPASVPAPPEPELPPLPPADTPAWPGVSIRRPAVFPPHAASTTHNNAKREIQRMITNPELKCFDPPRVAQGITL